MAENVDLTGSRLEVGRLCDVFYARLHVTKKISWAM
jgi:hypothetical protein